MNDSILGNELALAAGFAILVFLYCLGNKYERPKSLKQDFRKRLGLVDKSEENEGML